MTDSAPAERVQDRPSSASTVPPGLKLWVAAVHQHFDPLLSGVDAQPLSHREACELARLLRLIWWVR
jgi:hypothetical protein